MQSSNHPYVAQRLYIDRGRISYHEDRSWLLKQCRWSRRNVNQPSRFYQNCLVGLRRGRYEVHDCTTADHRHKWGNWVLEAVADRRLPNRVRSCHECGKTQREGL